MTTLCQKGDKFGRSAIFSRKSARKGAKPQNFPGSTGSRVVNVPGTRHAQSQRRSYERRVPGTWAGNFPNTSPTQQTKRTLSEKPHFVTILTILYHDLRRHRRV